VRNSLLQTRRKVHCLFLLSIRFTGLISVLNFYISILSEFCRVLCFVTVQYRAVFTRVDCVAVVESAPVFTRPLANTRVTEGQKVQLECHVTGSPEPELSWFLDGVELSSSAEVIISRQGWACYLIINEVLSEDEGKYSVIASNAHGTTSTAAYLTVISK